MERVALSLVAVCLALPVNAQDEHLSLAELEGDVKIIMALDAAAGETAPRSEYLKQLLTQARERKRGFQNVVARVGAGIPASLLNSRSGHERQFRVELYRTLLRTRFQPPDQYRKLDARDARLVRLACLMRHHKVSTVEDLGEVLRIYDSSLALQHRAYFEERIGRARARRR